MKRGSHRFGVVVCVWAAGGSLLAGELTKRQQEIVEGIVTYAPWDCPDRWLYELGDAETRNTTLRGSMVEAASWIDFLALANALDWSTEEARRTHEVLLKKLPSVSSGKARQNILFLIALTAPDAVKRLGPVFTGQKTAPEDKADAGCALAALGDEAAIAWLAKEFKTTDVFLGKPVFEFGDYRKEEADEKNRAAVRSYRFWEVIFRRPYYRRLEFMARAGIYRMTAPVLSDTERDALAARLLPLFIARWHGHPGSDDIAMRMLNYAVQKRDLTSIYVWAQRASLLPDQDCAGGAVTILTALADSQLSVQDIDEILASPDGKQNRPFLQYERFLKTVRRDLDAGLDYFDKVARAEPASIFAKARKMAAKVRPSSALRDGVLQGLSLKILLGYPKRSLALGNTPYQPEKTTTEDAYLGVLTTREREIVLRTKLKRSSSVSVDASRLASQYRLLLELRNLKQWEEQATDPAEKADVRYRQAKMFYRESRIVFPIWGGEIMNFGYRLNAVRYDAEADKRLEAYVGEVFALRRAYAILDSIRVDYPDYHGMDLVLFHMGHCYAKLMDYRPAKTADTWSFPDKPAADSPEDRLEYAHRRVGELFRELINEHPASAWAQQVERAADYHEKMVRVLRAKREKGGGTGSPRTEELPRPPTKKKVIRPRVRPPIRPRSKLF